MALPAPTAAIPPPGPMRGGTGISTAASVLPKATPRARRISMPSPVPTTANSEARGSEGKALVARRHRTTNVQDGHANPEQQTIGRTVTALARSFGFHTVVEGVEPHAELDYLVRE